MRPLSNPYQQSPHPIYPSHFNPYNDSHLGYQYPPTFTQQAAPAHQVVTATPTIYFQHPGLIYTENTLPFSIRCYQCQSEGLTRAETRDGAVVWIACISCCLFGCVLCAPCVFCADSLKEIQHYCSACQALVAVKKPCTSL